MPLIHGIDQPLNVRASTSSSGGAGMEPQLCGRAPEDEGEDGSGLWDPQLWDVQRHQPGPGVAGV